jgi:DNA-binding MltR family transcriptional regulator
LTNFPRSHKVLLDVLNNENDLSVILVGTSFLDASLSSILERKFICSKVASKVLDSRKGALGSFAARADICYLLGVIGKALYGDLLKIGEIRNEIAHHHLSLSFNKEILKKKCNELSYVQSLKQGNSNELLGLSQYMVSARNQFVLSVVMISQRLLLIGLELKRDDRKV